MNRVRVHEVKPQHCVANCENERNPERLPQKLASKPTATTRTALGDVGNRQMVDRQAPGKKLNVDTKIPKPQQVILPKQNLKLNGVTTKPTILPALKSVKSPKAAVKPVLQKNDLPSRHIALAKPKKDVEDDPQLVSEYAADIIKYLMEMEDKYPIQRSFLKQHSVTDSMRRILVNWMAEVCDNHKFQKETFHISVSLVDRYLPRNKDVNKKNFQLIGTAAMVIASKYEEIILPNFDDWLYLTNYTFKSYELFEIERDMLCRLEFNLGRPTSLVFLRRYNKLIYATLLVHSMGKYIIELATMESELAHIKPSMQAAAACCLAKFLLSSNLTKPENAWCSLLVTDSTYKFADIENLVYDFAAMIVKSESSKHKAIREMYQARKNNSISCHTALSGAKIKSLARMAKTIHL